EERRVQAIRVVPAASRSPGEQNVFFRRMRPMVRVSFNGQPWSLFLLDTGSEATMVTPTGLQANRFAGYEPSAPITLEGIGQSRVSWSKVSDVTLGISKWAVWFRNVVVNEGSEGIGDGVVGMSFLAPFDAELRFSSMTLTLERAGERRARDAEPRRPPGASPEPGS
ncbi:MAG TPA: retropepsin-like aspartic protease, partial [Thermoanaerobaculia bacterium]|nr:retropepsin-like aspartic protease [Thermoanaerobaculia bacterium]